MRRKSASRVAASIAGKKRNDALNERLYGDLRTLQHICLREGKALTGIMRYTSVTHIEESNRAGAMTLRHWLIS
jgi:hypothetical protein